MNKKSFTKKDLSNCIQKNTGFSHNFSKKLIEDLLQILSTNIDDGYLNLKNIGTFKLSNKKERKGRNPKTKENFLISARRSVRFRSSKYISEHISKFYE